MKKIKFLLPILFAVLGFANVCAQLKSPIKWNTVVEQETDSKGVIKLTAAVEQGWHLYGMELPEGGPRPTVIELPDVEGVEFGAITPSVKPVSKVDMVFHLRLSWWESDVTFSIPYTLSGAGANFDIKVSYQGCNDNSCIAPQKELIPVSVGNPSKATETDTAEIEEVITDKPSVKAKVEQEKQLWQPVSFPVEDENSNVTSSPWWYIFLLGFGGGFIALLTPCVWPMIPMTVSFFLKRSSNRSKAVRDAIIYGVSIIVIYLALGLAITAVFGAGKLNELATNAVFNLAFFLLLVVFAVSFFGAFDITLPSKWSNSMDSKAETTSGLISIFFMAFTLALVSFSCTGPIIGTLLVEAASMGDLTGPAIGMGGFALALALPFSVFAIFPSMLKEVPRSGGWMNSVKVVLGFLELALSLKFLSVADLAYGWGILDREVFVSLWIAIFIMLALYLLGKINFSHDTPVQKIGVTRFFLALVSLSFSLYLLPGLWGAPLKGVSAFVPPLYTQDFNLYEGGRFEEYDNYDKGMEAASEQKLPVLIDFSGYGCVNCRKMEGAVFDTPEVEKIVKEKFVLIKLMVDDKTPLEKKEIVMENGKKTELETVGDKWSYLQRTKFAANSQPYYIILNNDGEAMTAPAYYDEDKQKFINWLESGIEYYNKH